MIVHGIPGPYRLKEGDIISIDCGAIIDGYHGDAAFTAAVGQVTDEAARLMKVTEESLFAGIDADGRRQPPLRHRPRRPDGGRGRRVLGGAGVRRPRHRHRHAREARGARTTAPPGRGPEAAAGHGVRRRADGERRRRRRPGCSTTAGAWSPPTAASPPTSSTPSPSPTTARRSSPSRDCRLGSRAECGVRARRATVAERWHLRQRTASRRGVAPQVGLDRPVC